MGKYSDLHTLRDSYFHWLCGLVNADDPNCSYYDLMRILFDTEFRWSIRNDENRAQDGILLRGTFLKSSDSEGAGIGDIQGPCTVLEMLIALATRIDIDIMWDPDKGDQTMRWFWEMVQNLGLDGFDDDDFEGEDGYRFVPFIVDRWLDRRYRWDGIGGLFPLKNPTCDQRETEIWYQMNVYMIENYGVEEDLEGCEN